MTLALMPAATPVPSGSQLKEREALGAHRGYVELLHSTQGIPGGHSEFTSLTSVGYLCLA